MPELLIFSVSFIITSILLFIAVLIINFTMCSEEES